MTQEVKREHPTKDEKNRFLILVNHWIKHNHEHISEYLKLAKSLESQGLYGVAGSIREACEFVLQANESLSGARNMLEQYQPESGYSQESKQISQAARSLKPPGKRS